MPDLLKLFGIFSISNIIRRNSVFSSLFNLFFILSWSCLRYILLAFPAVIGRKPASPGA